MEDNALRTPRQKRIRLGLSLLGNIAHFIHDGITDMFYVFFPVWQVQWALSFTQVGLLKTIVSGTMALFQIPAGILANRIGRIRLLLIGTVITSLAVLFLGWVRVPYLLGLFLFVCGLGSSVQHPLSSAIISDAYTDVKARRTALSILNFVGDTGKLVLPLLAAFLILHFRWQTASYGIALFALIIVVIMAVIKLKFDIPDNKLSGSSVPIKKDNQVPTRFLLGWKSYQAFWALSAIGFIDGATRMAFLTFFPFLLHEKGASVALVGFCLSLIFAGGAAGKLVCGIMATRIGILRSVILTESICALCIWGMISVSWSSALLLAPILGIVLNGTSSVLYGSVPELVPEAQCSQAFSIFYTVVIGSGAIAPSLYGLLSDFAGVDYTVTLIAVIVLLTLPLTLFLRGKFKE